MSDKRVHLDLAIARLAANQHGVVSLEQLLAIGLDLDAISYRVRVGRLHRIHRGVYAVGHRRLTFEGRCKAAVFACGPEAALSHRSAAALWGMLAPSSGVLDVTVPRRGGRRQRRGIRLHRSTTLHPAQTTLRAGIPVTTPARTLADLHRCATPDDLAKARRQAELRGYRLGEEAAAEPDRTRTELERRFLALCRRHGLPRPEVNAPIGEYVVDFLWRDTGLIVETDSYRFHGGRAAFEYDYRRQARLIAAGFEVLRFTWRQVVDEPDQVLAAVRARLDRPLPSPVGRAEDRIRPR
jgi:very-short-patch-repair endonuclease